MHYEAVSRYIPELSRTIGYVVQQDLDNPGNGKSVYIETDDMSQANLISTALNAL